MFRRTSTSRRPANRLNSTRLFKTRLWLTPLEERTVPTVFTVTNTNDTGSGSLRQAILDVNADANPDADTINITATGTINVAGQMTVTPTADLSIVGPGATSLTLSNANAASATSRIFNITAAKTVNVSISSLTFANGNLASGNNGGAILSGASGLAISNSVFTANRAGTSGGAIAIAADSTTTNVTLNNSTFSNNIAPTNGGGLFFSAAPLSLNVSKSTFLLNSAATSGAGIYLLAGTGTSATTIDQSNFQLNTGGSGVGLYVSGSPSSVDVTNSLFYANSGTSSGGAIYFSSNPTTINIDNTSFELNVGSSGGAIYYSSSPPAVTINNSVFSGNTATSSHGGGMYFFTGGSATISSSSFDGNVSGPSGDGGAIAIWTASVSVQNSTLTNNTARGSSGGGAISVRSSAATFTLQDSTVVGNRNVGGTVGGGGVRFNSSATALTMNNSIVAQNSTSLGVGPDLNASSALTASGDGNFIGVGNAGNVTVVGQTGTLASPLVPGVGPIGYYGGNTRTMAPLTGSPVIDQGNNTSGAIYDQRGSSFPRVVGSAADVGAVEGPENRPVGSFVQVPRISVDGSTTNTFQVVYTDPVSVNTGTIGTNDVTVTAPNGASVPVSAASFAGSGGSVTATYTFAVPGGTWDIADNGVYTINQVAGAVSGASGSVAAGTLGRLAATVGRTYTINSTGDDSTGNGGSGFAGDLRYVLTRSNASAGLPDTIIFDPTVFASAQTITINAAASAPAISDAVLINNTATGKVTIAGNNRPGFVISAAGATTISNVTISGFSSTVVGGAFSITNAGAVATFNNVTVTGNKTTSATGGGGFGLTAAATLNINNSTVSNNTVTGAGGDGGVVRGTTNSTVNITNSTLSGNSTVDDGGAIYLTGANLSIVGSTINSNVAGSASTTADGGAILFTGTVGAGGFVIRNSTFSANTAGGSGGAVQLTSTFSGTATITNNTFTLNLTSANTAGFGGAISRQAGAVNLESNIISGNSLKSGAPAANGPDLFGAASLTLSYNAIGTSTGFSVGAGVGNLVGAPVALGLLANNGGATFTHLPAGGSPVRNAGSNPGALTTDQRGVGYSRVLQGTADIGSVESTDPTPLSKLTAVPPILVTGSTPNTVTITYTDDVGINYSSIDINDITITGPGGPLTITGVSVDIASNGTPRVATYTFTPPSAGSWAAANNGTYTVAIVANQVADIDGSTNYVTAGSIGTFAVGIGASIVVNATNDESVDTDSKTSLREAILASNANGYLTADTITFDPTVFAAPTTITLGGTELLIAGNLTIAGPAAAVSVNAASKSRVFNINDAVNLLSVTVNNLTVTGGSAAGGAGINNDSESLTLNNVTVTGNTSSGNGGGIRLLTSASLVANDSTISNNKATGNGGGIDGGPGGGVLTFNYTTLANNLATSNGGAVGVGSATVTFFASTLSGNSAGGAGGAVYNNNSKINLDNSTVSGNNSTGNGGGFHIAAANQAMTIRNSTIAYNTAGGANAGGINFASGTGTLSLASTIVFGNFSTNASPVALDIYNGAGQVTTIAYSLVYDISGSNLTDLGNNLPSGTDPLLLPLGNYGGKTATHVLQPGSPALNAGSNPGSFSTDQRGLARVQSGQADIGSTEGVYTKPIGILTPLGPIVAPGTTPNTVEVKYTDDVGIDVSSIGIADITITAPDGKTLIPVTSVSTTGSGTNVTATYTFTVPGGSWTGSWETTGQYTVSLVAGQVLDLDSPTPQSNNGSTLGTFLVDLPSVYVVDEISDVDDGNTSVGKRSLREAITRANATAAADSITFSPSVFSSANTITLNSQLPTLTSSVDITGPAAGLTLNAAGKAYRQFAIDVPGSTLNPFVISNLTLSGGSAATGSIIQLVDEDLTLNNVTVTGGAASGAVVLTATAAKFKATNSTFSNNTSPNGGAAIYITGANGNQDNEVVLVNCTLSGNTSSGTNPGGAMYFFWGGKLIASGTTFSGNKAAGASGGAVALYIATAELENCTFTDNSSSSYGGAISMISTSSAVSANFCTFASNVSGTSGGGAIGRNSTAAGTISLTNSIVATNTTTSGVGPDIWSTGTGFVVDGDYNFIGVGDKGNIDLSAQVNSIIGTLAAPGNPQLTALGSFGGPTQIRVLQVGSPALNKADPGIASPAYDQRGVGFPRVLSGQADIGAVEGPLTIPVATFNPFGPVSVPGAAPNTLTVTYTDDNAINYTTIDKNDVQIFAPDGITQLPVTGASVNIASNGTPRTATYTFTLPGGSWDFGDNGIYTVKMVANQVADTDVTVGYVTAGTLGTFNVGIPSVYTVDTTADLIDALDGKTSLREAVIAANKVNSLDTITFDPTVFNPGTITLNSVLSVTDGVIINGLGASKVVISGGGASQLFNVAPATAGQVVQFNSLTLTSASTTAAGGAIASTTALLSVINSVVSSNTGANGGAIAVTGAGGTLTIAGSVFNGNVATTGRGGAINTTASNAMTISNSAFISNQGLSTSSYASAIAFTGPFTVTNSTVSGNITASTGISGALYFATGANGTVTSSTISGNVSSGSGGGIGFIGGNVTLNNTTVFGNQAVTGGNIYVSSGTVTLFSTIVAGGIGTTSNPDVSGTTLAKYSLIGSTTGTTLAGGSSNNVLNVSPNLNGLGNNGGFVLPDGSTILTHLPANGSPVHNAGSDSLSLSNDQRGAGYPRLLGAAVDIGSIEYSDPNPSNTLGVLANVTVAGATSYTFTVTYADDQSNIDLTTIGTDDVTVTGPGGYSKNATPVSNTGAGKSVTVTYSIPAPDNAVVGAFDQSDNGNYTVTVNAGSVSDTDSPTPSKNLGTVGGFTVGIPVVYTVDSAPDVDDSITTSGNLSLREAVRLANADNTASSIVFNAAALGASATLTLDTELSVTADVTITGYGATKLTLTPTTLNANRIFNITTGAAAVTIDSIALTGGGASGGGAILNSTATALTVSNSILSNNVSTATGITATGGGAISTPGGSVTVINSVLSNNVSGSGAGAINASSASTITVTNSALVGNSADVGGAIRFWVGGDLQVTGSTMSGNSASNATYGGGAVYLWSGTANITNSTISGNSASGNVGGGIGIFSTATMTVRNSTFANNSALNSGGGIGNTSTGLITIVSSIFGDNVSGSGGADINTTGSINVTTSVIETAPVGTVVGTPIIGDAGLGVLADNGGFKLADGSTIQTHAITSTSNAYNAGSNPGGLTTDQRGAGFARVGFGTADAGAFEVQPLATPAKVLSVSVNGGGVQRSNVTSLVVTFDNAPTFSGPPASAFTLERFVSGVGTGNTVTLAASVSVNTVTLTFSGPLTQAVTNSLIDGVYQLRIDDAFLTNLDGDANGTIGGDYSTPTTSAGGGIFRLFGDSDGNATVNSVDFLAFRLAFLSSNPTFDYNGSGTVDSGDFLQFRLHFLQSV